MAPLDFVPAPDVEAFELVPIKTGDPAPRGSQIPSYRYALPAGPWPWLDVEGQC